MAQPDIVENLTLENIKMIRLNATIQPNMQNGVSGDIAPDAREARV